MLSPAQTLPYEDVAKLNPFYEEYRSFWNTSPKMEDTTLPSDTPTNSSRSIGSRSEFDQSLYSPEILSLPPVLDFQPNSVGASAAERLHVAIHDGYEYTPTYNTHPEATASQTAILEYDSPRKQPLLPVEGPIDICERKSFELYHINSPLGQSRSSHKKLFGRNGWLGRTADLENLSSEKHRSKNLKDLRKKIVDGFTEGIAKASQTIVHEPRGMKDHLPQSTIPISLNPPIQAMLYSELEVMICVSANVFLVEQYHEGRLSGESIKRIKNYWGSKNRPSVVEFQFDQATQQRLIMENKRSLRFHGESSTNPVLLSSNLHNWKAIVKEMSIRTFCAPDSMIRKHMHDVYKLLDMLGAPISTLVICQKLHMQALSLMGHRVERCNYADRQ
ncbi:hypothetical protein BDV27DRAFT_152433 [Aspergillus caelatus]|uniref:Uncharacterized protein n=1 Tax=Aspergillus caelatus TaxID=61420 RepID=A0A5N7ALA8_9EURO|nr:uncharacterized protein BDV27DRAFT_152433 [Aspergillus caelatus]KAE8370016.1 hypothetical protein BDV27DRAFT_152433 [Aspergillus caelatus]